MIRSLLEDLKHRARAEAAKLPAPALYRDHAEDASFVWETFFNHPLLRKLQDETLQFLYDDYMFGIEHAKKSAQDAGLLTLLAASMEDPDMHEEERRRLSILAQATGLLCGLEKGGFEGLCDTASHLLERAPLEDGERAVILGALDCLAGTKCSPGGPAGVLCDCLYDASKFRYGSDILSTALWMHCEYQEARPDQVRLCLGGLRATIENEPPTFRTVAGRTYGPEILDQGQSVLAEMILFLEEL